MEVTGGTILNCTKLLVDESTGGFHEIIEIWNALTQTELLLVSDHISSDQYLIITDREETVVTAMLMVQTDKNYSEKPIYWINPSKKTISKHSGSSSLMDRASKQRKIRANRVTGYLQSLLVAQPA